MNNIAGERAGVLPLAWQIVWPRCFGKVRTKILAAGPELGSGFRCRMHGLVWHLLAQHVGLGVVHLSHQRKCMQSLSMFAAFCNFVTHSLCLNHPKPQESDTPYTDRHRERERERPQRDAPHPLVQKPCGGNVSRCLLAPGTAGQPAEVRELRPGESTCFGSQSWLCLADFLIGFGFRGFSISEVYSTMVANLVEGASGHFMQRMPAFWGFRIGLTEWRNRRFPVLRPP